MKRNVHALIKYMYPILLTICRIFSEIRPSCSLPLSSCGTSVGRTGLRSTQRRTVWRCSQLKELKRFQVVHQRRNLFLAQSFTDKIFRSMEFGQDLFQGFCFARVQVAATSGESLQ